VRPDSLGPDTCLPNPDGSCSICGDEAIPGVIECIVALSTTAKVRTGSGLVSVALDLLEDASVGDTVMTHLGFAIGRITTGDAERRANTRVGHVTSPI